jgi:putative protein kinase ArgK-like GTPase of G3E family
MGTNARESKGMSELIHQIDDHQEQIIETGEIASHRRRRYETELIEIIRKRLMNLIFDEAVFKEKVEGMIDRIEKKEEDPYSAAEEILSTIIK